MNKQHSNEMGSIRKKLLAAVAMLLVACVMTVSSTYAWFTLSTAPEVKGITTTVGANGNLEIALGYYDTVYGNLVPGSGEGDSMDKAGQTIVGANTTWGNLVDLSDPSYGLGAITLYPSRLNAAGNKITSVYSPLSYPKYGSDGRIIELVGETLLGKYDSTASGFVAKDTPDYAGVNAIGSASSMTAREFAVRNNRNAIESNRVAAMAEAQGAINLYSGDLAAIAINNINDVDTNTITADEAAILNALILKLEASNKAIGESIKSALMLFLASEDSALSDELWQDAVTVIDTNKYDIKQTVSYLETLSGLGTLPVVSNYIDKYDAIATALSDAKTAMTNAATDSTYEWSEVKLAVNNLLNASGILICGETISDIKNTKDSPDADTAFKRVTAAVMNGGLVFQFSATSGVFADIAEMTGAYNATISFPAGLEVEGIPLGGLKKPVEVQSSSNLLAAMKVATDNLSAPGAAAGAQKALTDTYGYTVDLLFRTNASDSYLQLQTVGQNRIYANDTKNPAIQGEGSNMTFTISGEYTKDKIDGVASGIRVVFYDTGDGEILGIATLDTANGTVTGNNYKLNLVLQNYSIDAEGIVTTTGAKIDDGTTTVNESCALAALTANTVKKVTALVYLDGDRIDNGDIGIAAELNGKLNLQFSSSAALDPMDNNDLLNGAN